MTDASAALPFERYPSERLAAVEARVGRLEQAHLAHADLTVALDLRLVRLEKRLMGWGALVLVLVEAIVTVIQHHWH